MIILVTGGSGFVGKHLVKRLKAEGHTVANFDILDDGSDIRNPLDLRVTVRDVQPALIYHLAAQAFVPKGFESPGLTFAVNAQGTVNLLDAARLYAPKAAIVVVSSDKVYGDTGAAPAREGEQLVSTCPYSASKIAAENAARLYRETYGLRVATARAGNIIGPGDHFGVGRLVPNAIERLRQGLPVQVYDPARCVLGSSSRTSFRATASSARPFATIPSSPVPGTSGPRDHHTVAEVVLAVVKAWRGMGGEVNGSGFELVKRELHEVAELRIDSSMAGNRLGWIPQWSFEDMIRETVAGYKAGG